MVFLRNFWSALCAALLLPLIGAVVIIAQDTLAPTAIDEQESLTVEEIALIKAAQQRRIDSVAGVYGSVVAVYGSDKKGGGSAVIYDERGFALTNHHVVAGAGKQGWGGLADGKQYRWNLIGTDPGGDVAIIQLTGKDKFPAAPIGNSDLVRVGDWAMAMGNPFLLAEDQRPTVTLGIVSGVKRYQHGAGLNTLVYGNCIQIDSSINPGNSGGPLFNLSGQIIGINGRGSFKERGRVNVGLGYAISSNQIKNFLPDLLATKIAQHGTLDALFGDRGGKVICETINLDAPIADLGLDLGDELLEFEGQKITSANQFTNLVSTLPADWPTHLVIDQGGQRKELWVRLYALPYKAQQAPPQPMPKGKDGDDKEKKEPPKIPAGPKVAIVNPGTIRDAKLNLENCRYVIGRWKESVGVDQQASKYLKCEDQILREDLSVGSQTIVTAADGRFFIELEEGDDKNTYGYDGKQFWAAEGDEPASQLTMAKALLNPYISQVATLAALFHEKPLESFGELQLDGSDKSQRLPAYRIKATDAEGDWFYVWLSVINEQSNLEVRLLKASPDIDGDGPQGAVTYSDWRPVGGVQWPHRRDFVRGLSEKRVVSFVTENCEWTDDISEAVFEKPDAKEN